MTRLAGRYHGAVERTGEVAGPWGGVRAVLLFERRCFVVGDRVVVDAVVCNQTDATLHCRAVLQQVRVSQKLHTCRIFCAFSRVCGSVHDCPL